MQYAWYNAGMLMFIETVGRFALQWFTWFWLRLQTSSVWSRMLACRWYTMRKSVIFCNYMWIAEPWTGFRNGNSTWKGRLWAKVVGKGRKRILSPLFFGTARIVSAAGFMSVPSIDHCSSVRRVCCWAPGGQEILIDCCPAWAPSSNQ